MATLCSIFAWRIPRTEEPGGLQSMGSLGVYLLSHIRLLCTPRDCKPPGSSAHGISVSQARILEWVAIFSPGHLSKPVIKPMSPTLVDRLFCH